MKVPLNWLKEYISVETSPAHIAKLLTMAGLEVDAIDTVFSAHDQEGEVFFEISLTPNLAHCMSILGVARELSAITGLPFRPPRITLEEKDTSIQNLCSVHIHNKEKCPRYLARVITGIQVKESPEWLKNRLTLAGIRPVNIVVDVTNFVMMELGHPLHAFDLQKVAGHEIVVRNAREGECIETLDGKTRTLAAEDLIISDQEKPIALAGVMGGLNSEIDENTTSILLESAYFLPSTVRRTSKRLGLTSDASKRFERGTDPNGAPVALDRAAMMLHQLTGGIVAEGVIDCREQEFKPLILECRLSRIHKILGISISASEVENVFHRLDWLTSYDGQNIFSITVPTYRTDVREEIDLIEEVARIYGYDNIHTEAPRYPSCTLPHSPLYLMEKEVRSRLIRLGLQELLTCDLIGPSLLGIIKDSAMPPEAFVHVKNPTSIEQSILRTSMLPGLLEVAKYNFDRQIHDLRGFEIGKIHFRTEKQYHEQSVAGVVLMGKEDKPFWGEKNHTLDFYTLKGIIETFLNELGIPTLDFRKGTIANLHPGRQASIYVGELEVGSLGEVHPDLLDRLGLPQRVYFAEINLQDLQKVRDKTIKAAELPIYPGSDRDWTVTLDDRLPMQRVMQFIQTAPTQYLEKFSLIDIYRNDKLGPHGINATFHFYYRDGKKTILQEDVDADHARILTSVQAQLSHELAKLE